MRFVSQMLYKSKSNQKQKRDCSARDKDKIKKKIKESETNIVLKRLRGKKYWRSYAHRNNKACDLFKMCVDPEPEVSEAPSNK